MDLQLNPSITNLYNTKKYFSLLTYILPIT